MNRIITLGDLVGGLKGPLELQDKILGYLNPSDMSVATCVNQRINNGIGLVWERIERTLGYQVDPKQTLFRNYNNFVGEIMSVAESIYSIAEELFLG